MTKTELDNLQTGDIVKDMWGTDHVVIRTPSGEKIATRSVKISDENDFDLVSVVTRKLAGER